MSAFTIFIDDRDDENILAAIERIEKIAGFGIEHRSGIIVNADSPAVVNVIEGVLGLAGCQFYTVHPPEPAPELKDWHEANQWRPGPASEITVTTAQPTTKKCAYCDRPAQSSRHKTCGSAECDAAKRKEWNERYESKQQTSAREPQDKEEHTPGGVVEKPVYKIETGPRSGEQLTSAQMGTALRLRHVFPGQIISHIVRGRFKVIEKEGKNGKSLAFAKVKEQPHGTATV